MKRIWPGCVRPKKVRRQPVFDLCRKSPLKPNAPRHINTLDKEDQCEQTKDANGHSQLIGRANKIGQPWVVTGECLACQDRHNGHEETKAHKFETGSHYE